MGVIRRGDLIEGGSYFSTLSKRGELLEGGDLIEGGELLEEIRYFTLAILFNYYQIFRNLYQNAKMAFFIF